MSAGESEQGGSGGNRMWGGRFSQSPTELVQRFTASIDVDARLALIDIRGSIAHARMLGRQQIIPEADAQAIVAGLEDIAADVRAGRFVWRAELEDVHMNIEHALIERIGPVGGKLHTARSRNDQVATDMHLYVLEELTATRAAVRRLQEALLSCARAHVTVIIPGYTHLQRAQPVLLAHHLLAYFWMLERDHARLEDAAKRADLCPLGAGALAGTTFAIDREQTAAALGFGTLYENSMDAVSDRDYLLEALSVLLAIALHLSRLAEEVILWSSAEFGFIELADAYTTGSSIMPQKKNPDVAELVRGKTGGVLGHLVALATTLKGLPLTYNRDMQEDKAGVFAGFDTVQTSLQLFAGMIATLQVQEEAIARTVGADHSAATDLADHLARRGVPFRDAHRIVGEIVADCVERGRPLAACSIAQLAQWSPLFADLPEDALSASAVVRARSGRGATGPEAVVAQMAAAERVIFPGN